MQGSANMGQTARVTLVLPSQLWEQVKRLAPAGRRSQLVAEALEAEVSRREQEAPLERIRQFQDYLFQKYGEMPSCVDDINQMREERDAEILGLR
jgi:hypothetical protein